MQFSLDGVECEVTNFSRYEWKFNMRAKPEYIGNAEEFLFLAVEENGLDDCNELIVELKPEQTKDGTLYYYAFSCEMEDGKYHLHFLHYYTEG